MIRRSLILFATPGNWRIGIAEPDGSHRVITVSADSNEVQTGARLVAETLRSEGYANEPVLIALPSAQCLSATIDTAGLPRRDRQRAALYRLEEKLPLAAEDVWADFVYGEQTALGVCTRGCKARALVDAFTAEAINVAAVTPASMLALGAACQNGLVTDADVLVWQTRERLDVYSLAAGRLTRWTEIAASGPELSLALAVEIISRKSSIRVATIGLGPDLRERIRRTADVKLIGVSDLCSDEAAIRTAARVLRGDEPLAIDLLGEGRPRIASRQLRRAVGASVAAVLILCLSLAVSFWIRATRYSNVAAGAEDRKVAVFRQLFPHDAAPAGIGSRLRAVQRQLQVSRGARAAPNGAGGPDAFASFADLLAHLPTEARYRITELEIDGTRLSLQGEVNTHGDADAVADALRGAGGFQIDDPQTQQLESSVRFSISGVVRAGLTEVASGRAP